MSAPTLKDAYRLVESRREAAGLELGGTFTVSQRAADLTGAPNARSVLVGFDLDVDELEEGGAGVAYGGLQMIVRDNWDLDTVKSALAGAWLNGVLCGLALAELRARQDQEGER